MIRAGLSTPALLFSSGLPPWEAPVVIAEKPKIFFIFSFSCFLVAAEVNIAICV